MPGLTRALRSTFLVLLVVAAAWAALTWTRRASADPRVVRNVTTSQIYRRDVWLIEGRQYEFRTTNLAPGVDPVMHLVDANNVEIRQNDDFAPPDLNSRISFTPSVGRQVYVVVRSYGTFTAGFGTVQWRSPVVGGTWGSWTNLQGYSPTTHFGGAMVDVEDNQHEYWSVMVQPVAGGSSDIVMYGMYIPGQFMAPALVLFDDDSGVGRMARITRGTRQIQLLLVGTYDGVTATTDLVANDRFPDADGDTLGAGLEAELGICDGPTTSPACSTVWYTGAPADRYADSDHDRLSDFHEVLGVDQKYNWEDPQHLPA